jgi:hypothetical protein
MKKAPTALNCLSQVGMRRVSKNLHCAQQKHAQYNTCYNIIKVSTVYSLISQCNAHRLQTTIKFLFCNYPH